MLPSERIIRFGETFCICTGDQYGQPFRFTEWQKERIRKVYDNLDANGNRIVKLCHWEIPRKAGKTSLAAVLALYHLVTEKHKEIYSVAPSRKQAAILFSLAKEIVNNSPELKKRIKIQRNVMFNVSAGTKYEVLSSDGGKQHGFNPAIVFMDEMHEVKDGGRLFNAMWNGMINRSDRLMICITSAGDDRTTHCYQQHLLAESIIDGSITNPEFDACIYGLKEGEDWESEDNWRKANPSLGVVTPIESYRSLYRLAKVSPTAEAEFRNRNLNQWISGDVKWIPEELWLQQTDETLTLDDFAGMPCVCGLDLATVQDMPAFAAVFYKNERYYAFCKFWISESSLDGRVKNEHANFRDWVKKGWVDVSGQHSVSLVDVREYICAFAKRFNIVELNIDPMRFNQEMVPVLLENDINVVQHKQNTTSMTGPTEELERLVRDKVIQHDGNGCLAWNFGNTVLYVDTTGNRKPNKKAAKDRIDGVVALIMATGRAVTLLKSADNDVMDGNETSDLDALFDSVKL